MTIITMGKVSLEENLAALMSLTNVGLEVWLDVERLDQPQPIKHLRAILHCYDLRHRWEFFASGVPINLELHRL